jgi:hypothetical protein
MKDIFNIPIIKNTLYPIITSNYSTLLKKNDVIVDRYYKNVHRGRVEVDLGWSEDNNFLIEMQDCEMIIEDYDTKETQILSVSDDLTPTSLNLQSYDNTKKIFISQFIRDKVYHHVNEKYWEKYNPWIYFPSNEYDLESYYEKRKNMINKQEKLYFRGETFSREILQYFNSDVFHGGNSIGGFDSYANELINFKLGLSVAGRGEICYRDFESHVCVSLECHFGCANLCNPPNCRCSLSCYFNF